MDNAMIDKYCQYKNGSVVKYCNSYMSCILNQTSIDKNNNKFYIMQIINTDDKYIYIM